MTGVAVSGLRDRLRALNDRQALRFLWSYGRNRKGALALHVVGSVAQSLLVLPVLWMIRHAFDSSIPRADTRELVLLGVGIFLLRVLGSWLALVLRRRGLVIVKGIITEMRSDLVAAMLGTSRARMDHQDPSHLHTRIVQEPERIDIVANAILCQLLPSLVSAVGIAAVLVWLDARLVGLGVLMVPVVVVASRFLWRRVRAEVERFQASFERFAKGLNFVLRQLDLIRLSSATLVEQRRQQSALETLREDGIRMAMTHAVHGQAQRTIVGLAGIIILVMGGIGVATGRLTLGSFLTFYVAAGLLNGHVSAVLSAVPELIAGNVALRTVEALLTDSEPEPYRGTLPVPALQTVELVDVEFAHGDRPILRGVTMRVARADNIAIVGANGAGKSTLASLLAGFYRPASGGILWNGLKYDDVDMQSLRRQLGFVQQHAAFFLGTIRENLLYGHDDATAEDIERALSLSSAHEALAKLPLGLDTMVGELGRLLSGGERQRLAIARALVGRPTLLILDEPTTHLDVESMHSVMQRLVEWPERPAILTITHDEAVQRFADAVWRLESGRLHRVDAAEPVWQERAG